MRNSKSRVDPFKGVVNPEILREQMKKMVEGDSKARSYCRGALNYLERKPPNPLIVDVLKRAFEIAK